MKSPRSMLRPKKCSTTCSIPDISVEQYASNLAKWFGLSQSDTLEVFPGLANFDDVDLWAVPLDTVLGSLNRQCAYLILIICSDGLCNFFDRYPT